MRAARGAAGRGLGRLRSAARRRAAAGVVRRARAGLRLAGGGRGLPPVPAPHIRGPGRALGWRRAGESGRVFPPPLGQAGERRGARPSLANPAPAPARPLARPAAFSRRLPPGRSGPAHSRLEPALGGRVRIRTRELSRARDPERCQHGEWDTAGAGDGAWGGRGGLAFPATLAKPQPFARMVPSEKWAGVAGCGVRPGAPCFQTMKHRGAGPGTERGAPVEGPAAGYAALRNPCECALPDPCAAAGVGLAPLARDSDLGFGSPARPLQADPREEAATDVPSGPPR